MMETLSNALERLVDQGFTAHFGVVGDRLRAFASEKTFGASPTGSAFLRDVPMGRASESGATGPA